MVNKVFLIGRLGKDPVIKHFQNDSAIAEFPLATTESYKDREGKWNEVTDWHNIKLPNKFMAERAEKYLKKEEEYYIMCQSGGRSQAAVKALSKLGYQVVNVAGGYGSYAGSKRA